MEGGEGKFIISRRLRWLGVKRYLLISGLFVAVIIAATAFFIFNRISTKASISPIGNVSAEFSNKEDPTFTVDSAGLVKSSEEKKATGELELDNGKISTELTFNGVAIDSQPEISSDPEANERFTVKLNKNNQFRPGKYQLQVEITSGDQSQTLTQDFTWGVLALNLDQSSYKIEKTANIGIGVLNDLGKTVCDAKVWLKLSIPTANQANYQPIVKQ